jgi:hypothetical protein
MTTAIEWADQVLADVLHVMARGDELVHGAEVKRTWTAVENGAPIVSVVHRHPWWPFPTGLRCNRDHGLGGDRSRTWSEHVAEELAHFNVGEPLGTFAMSMVPDSDGVWWWGDDPLPGDHSRRGPAPTGSR